MPDDLQDPRPSVEASVRPSRPRARRLTSDEIAELLDGCCNGEKVLDLAARYGVGKSTLLRHVADSGVPKRTETRSWSSEDLQAAVAMYREGASLTAVGDHFSIGSTTVWNRFRAAGVELRPPRGWDDR